MKNVVISPAQSTIFTQHKETGLKSTPQKAEHIFKKAVKEYNQGHVYNALQTARYALRVATRTQSYIKVYLCGFIAQIKMELGQSRLALAYVQQALNNLDRGHEDYAEDMHYYRALKYYLEKDAA